MRPSGLRAGATDLVAVAAGVAAQGAARAHEGSPTFGDVSVSGSEVRWSVRVRNADLAQDIRAPSGVARTALEESLARYAPPRLEVRTDAASCRQLRVEAAPAPDAQAPSTALTVVFGCGQAGGQPDAVSELVLRYGLFFEHDPLHRGFVSVTFAGGPPVTGLFRSAERELRFGAALPPRPQAAGYLLLGIEHIFTGYDHLAFIGALLLGASLRRARGEGSPRAPETRTAVIRAAQVVTAFTVAHSITLILSSLRVASLPTAWVEPAIALSVTYVGLENLRRDPPSRRWPLVFAFGLVHGLGFASVLNETGLPTERVVLSLLAFNLGVEAGQLAVVAIALPCLLWAARRSPRAFERLALRGGSAAVAAAGLIWFGLRIG